MTGEDSKMRTKMKDKNTECSSISAVREYNIDKLNALLGHSPGRMNITLFSMPPADHNYYWTLL
jgi:hypothetical protein